MNTIYLHIRLESDATFGRGDGVAGLVDVEVEHDRYGIPFLRGRTLKGLLVEECANLCYALGDKSNAWQGDAEFLFGRPGSSLDDDGEMFVGDASLPEDLRNAIAYAIDANQFTHLEILDSLTSIRRQSAMTVRGAPAKGSLRSMRVVLRETIFVAELTFITIPNHRQKALLAACVASLRRLGTGRNRGRGRVESCVFYEGRNVTKNWLDVFAAEIRK